jgi:hypothetical protein
LRQAFQAGKLFRKVSIAGKPWGNRVTEKLVRHVVKEFAARIGNDRFAPHDLLRYARAYVGRPEVNWSRFSFSSAMYRSRPLNATSAAHSELPPP